MKPRERLLSLIQRHECLDTFWLTDLRPVPAAARLASRATRSLATRRAFFILGEAADNLAHYHARRITGVGQIVTGRCDNANAELDQGGEPKLLRHEFTSEPRGILDNNHARTACDVSMRFRKPRPSAIAHAGLMLAQQMFLRLGGQPAAPA